VGHEAGAKVAGESPLVGAQRQEGELLGGSLAEESRPVAPDTGDAPHPKTHTFLTNQIKRQNRVLSCHTSFVGFLVGDFVHEGADISGSRVSLHVTEKGLP
jgi:hypothetical protein